MTLSMAALRGVAPIFVAADGGGVADLVASRRALAAVESAGWPDMVMGTILRLEMAIETKIWDTPVVTLEDIEQKLRLASEVANDGSDRDYAEIFEAIAGDVKEMAAKLNGLPQ